MPPGVHTLTSAVYTSAPIKNCAIVLAEDNVMLYLAPGCVLRAEQGVDVMIRLGKSGAASPTNRIGVIGSGACDCNNNAVFGILIGDWCNRVTIEGIEIYGSNQSGIFVSGYTNLSTNLKFRNIDIHNCQEGLLLTDCTDVEVVDSSFSDMDNTVTPADMVELVRGERIRIANNNFKDPGSNDSCLDIFAAYNGDVTRNISVTGNVFERTVTDSLVPKAISITGTGTSVEENVTITGNIFRGGFRYGIDIGLGANQVVINGNLFESINDGVSSLSYGVSISAAAGSNFSVVGNLFIDINGPAVILGASSSGVMVANNTFVGGRALQPQIHIGASPDDDDSHHIVAHNLHSNLNAVRQRNTPSAIQPIHDLYVTAMTSQLWEAQII